MVRKLDENGVHRDSKTLPGRNSCVLEIEGYARSIRRNRAGPNGPSSSLLCARGVVWHLLPDDLQPIGPLP